MNQKASIVTRVELDADRTIASGETISVFGIIVSNPNAGSGVEVEFNDASGNISFSVTVGCCDSENIPFSFVADGGLSISGVGDATVTVSVFHSNAGS